jgi:hypothetical protein
MRYGMKVFLRLTMWYGVAWSDKACDLWSEGCWIFGYESRSDLSFQVNWYFDTVLFLGKLKTSVGPKRGSWNESSMILD